MGWEEKEEKEGTRPDAELLLDIVKKTTKFEQKKKPGKKTPKQSFQAELKKNLICKLKLEISFTLEKQPFVFSCTSPPCFFHFVYSKQVYL